MFYKDIIWKYIFYEKKKKKMFCILELWWNYIGNNITSLYKVKP